MATGFRSKGNINPSQEFLLKLDKSVRDQLHLMQTQLEKVRNEMHSFNSRITNLESSTEAFASMVPSQTLEHSPPHSIQDSHRHSNSGFLPKFKSEVP